MKSLKNLVDATTGQIIVAHRGASGNAPENTLAAIRKALEVGAVIIEIDVQISADGHIVVIHDHTLERTTNGHGETCTFTVEKLRRLDAGSWFSPEFKGERIPLLHEVFDLLKGRACINIEIKPPAPMEDYKKRIDLIASTTLEAGFAPFTLFSSFHHDSLRYLRSISQEFHTAAILLPADDRMPSDLVKTTGCEVVVFSLEQLTTERAEDISQHSVFTGVYTINTDEELQRAIDDHVKGIVTDFPEQMFRRLQIAGQ